MSRAQRRAADAGPPRHNGRGSNGEQIRANNLEIARTLGVSNNTVRNQVSNIFAKLQVADPTEAILRAREAGLGRIDTDSD
jgi:DNA-binding CsgD family transcriptional regulator